MTWVDLAALAIAIGLLVFLTYALLRAERF